ncbi:uncharacterized protein BDR25DRAFT_352625 [Lindgomyces ingoldianus]|uniref:Uncharacterized protein n=1 Tax=Lindgomyces ingoldianus TaxID=673940 RepID=A0ACB6R424_9PLEO|nr:uncharacterized protein BDR25DRAFT_352625 [Lindgomyces ingoldianus]KAF2473181.1 hypothetical protein BDR25DRAFT_352625 [Lindgomyces ingoldianus]
MVVLWLNFRRLALMPEPEFFATLTLLFFYHFFEFVKVVYVEFKKFQTYSAARHIIRLTYPGDIGRTHNESWHPITPYFILTVKLVAYGQSGKARLGMAAPSNEVIANNADSVAGAGLRRSSRLQVQDVTPLPQSRKRTLPNLENASERNEGQTSEENGDDFVIKGGYAPRRKQKSLPEYVASSSDIHAPSLAPRLLCLFPSISTRSLLCFSISIFNNDSNVVSFVLKHSS